MSTVLPSDADPFCIGERFRSVARAIGQIVLQRHAATGALVFAGVLCASPRLACGLLLGTLAGALCFLHRPRSHRCRFVRVSRRPYGFNGALAALVAFAFVQDDSQAAALAIVTAIAAMLIAGRLSCLSMPAFSAPAILTTWCWLPLFADRGDTGAIPPVSADWQAIFEASFAGLAPITFATGAFAGALIALGIFAARPSRAGWTLFGSALGAVLHGLGGASDAVVLSGACGFNAALAAVPYGKRFAVASIVLAVLIERVIDCIGITALTAPFVLASWTVIAFVRYLARTSVKPAARIDLAAAYRLIALNGWDNVVYTHVFASATGEPGRFLINPFGLAFDEVTAGNLVKIDIDGNVIGDSAHPVNATGFARMPPSTPRTAMPPA